MFCRDARFSRLRDERVARLYSKSLLLSKLFVILNDFWISNKDYGINTKKTRRSNLVSLVGRRFSMDPGENIQRAAGITLAESCSAEL